jgi:predicted nucleic acid-binding protein
MAGGASSFVLDASMTLAWCFEDESTSGTDSVMELLREGRAVAPSIWPLEVANGLRSAERRGRIDERELPGVIGLLRGLPVDIQSGSLAETLGSVMVMARSLGLSTYDAAYLDLAARRGLPLATADDQLVRAARAAGVALIGEEV